MGNQVTNQHQDQQPTAQQQQQQPQKQKTERREKKKKQHWLPGKRKQQPTAAVTAASVSAAPPTKEETTTAVVAVQAKSDIVDAIKGSHDSLSVDTNNKCNGKMSTNNNNHLDLTATTTGADVVFVAADLTPSPDSANRTWSEDIDTTPPGQQSAETAAAVTAEEVGPPITAAAAAAAADSTRSRQRDSGVSQLSTEEFDRVFGELSESQNWHHQEDQPHPQEQHVDQALAPRLRVKSDGSPNLQQQRASACVTLAGRTEELLLLRQELLQRRSVCYSAVNDDHMFPNAVTPTKVDSGLVADYDVPYMDDDTFIVFNDWYVTDDKRWSYLRRSDEPQLADCDDCKLTVSDPNSAKPSPNATPKKSRRRALFGFCF